MALITRSLIVIRGVELFAQLNDALPNPNIRLFTAGAVAAGRNVRITVREQDGTLLDEQRGRATAERDMVFVGRALRLVSGKDGTKLGTGFVIHFEVSL